MILSGLSIGHEISSFEKLIEKQLQSEEDTARQKLDAQKTQNSKRPFLRRGDGIARFQGIIIPKKKKSSLLSRKSSNGANLSSHLPKTTLKLLPDISKPRSNKESDSLIVQPRDEVCTMICARLLLNFSIYGFMMFMII